MNLIETKLKRWGNSIGIVIPKETIEREHLIENKSVKFLIVKDSKKALKETFGIAKSKIKKSSQQIKDELRTELYG